MNKRDFAKFCMALKTYYPRENLLPNSESMALWYRQLQDLDFEVAEAILDRWVSTNKWSPSIADIREMAAEIKTGKSREWGDGWQDVLRAVQKYGSYNTEKAINSLDDITRQCVENIGYLNICRSENIAVERANFRMLYERYAERKKQDAQIPEHLKILIGQMSLKMIEGGNENDNGKI